MLIYKLCGDVLILYFSLDFFVQRVCTELPDLVGARWILEGIAVHLYVLRFDY